MKKVLGFVSAMALATPLVAQEAMTDAEKADFWAQIASCWMVPEGVRGTDVTVRFELDPRGRVVDRLVERVGTLDEATADMSAMYEAARRAILQCGRRGFDLPEEKYVYWQDIQMTFRSPSAIAPVETE